MCVCVFVCVCVCVCGGGGVISWVVVRRWWQEGCECMWGGGRVISNKLGGSKVLVARGV